MNLPLVDTHLHVWDPARLHYPWLEGVPFLNRPYLLSDYDEACRPLAVERMIFVQCECAFSQYREEVAWVTRLAGEDPRIQGVVSWAPLEKGDAVRAELAALAVNPLVKGIRRIIQFESELEFCRQPEFIRGVQALAEFDLHFEICIKGAPQFERAIALVKECPGVRFVLNHIAKPDIKDQTLAPWREQMLALADLPNVWCKISGLVTEADHQCWTPENLQPYIDWTLICFGWDRVMYGGDWPVAFQASTYPRWVETLNRALAEDATEHQRRSLFHDNAVRFYRLPVEAGSSLTT